MAKDTRIQSEIINSENVERYKQECNKLIEATNKINPLLENNVSYNYFSDRMDYLSKIPLYLGKSEKVKKVVEEFIKYQFSLARMDFAWGDGLSDRGYYNEVMKGKRLVMFLENSKSELFSKWENKASKMDKIFEWMENSKSFFNLE